MGNFLSSGAAVGFSGRPLVQGAGFSSCVLSAVEARRDLCVVGVLGETCVPVCGITSWRGSVPYLLDVAGSFKDCTSGSVHGTSQ